jgi:hypothetical protein
MLQALDCGALAVANRTFDVNLLCIISSDLKLQPPFPVLIRIHSTP